MNHLTELTYSIVTYLFSGVFFYLFLTYRESDKKHRIINIILSILYPVSAFTICSGLSLEIAPLASLFPLIMLGVEKIIKEKKPAIYVAAASLSAISNPEILLIPILFSFFYLIISEYEDINHFMSALVNKVLSDLFVVGISFFAIMLHSYHGGASLGISIRFPSYTFSANIYDTLSDMISGHPYVTSYIIFIFVLFVMNTGIAFYKNDASRWSGLKLLGLYILTFFSYYISTASYLFAGLNSNASEKHFHMFIFVFMSLLVVKNVLDKMESISIPKSVIAGAVSISTMVFTMIKRSEGGDLKSFVRAIEFLVFYMIIAIIISYAPKKKNIGVLIFSILMLGESVLLFSQTMISQIRSAVPYEKTDAYLIEQTRNNILQQYPDADILVYDENCHSNLVSNALLGIDYIITTDPEYVPDFNLIEKSELAYTGKPYTDSESPDHIRVFNNPDALRGALIMPVDSSNLSLSVNYPFSTANRFAEALGLPEIFIPVEDNISVRPDKKNITSTTSSTLVYTFDEAGDYYVNFERMVHFGTLNPGEEREYTVNISITDCQQSIIKRESVMLDKAAAQEFFKYIKDNSAAITKTDDAITIDASHAAGKCLLIPGELPGTAKSSDTASLYGSDITIIDVDGYMSSNVNAADSSNTSAADSSNIITISTARAFPASGLIISLVSLMIFICLAILSGQTFIKRKKVITLSIRPNKFTGFLSDNKVYFYTILITTTLWTAFAMIHSAVPFGGSSFLVSDGYIEDYPTTTHFIENLRALNFYSIDYTYGYMTGGLSMGSLLYFLNPFRLILLLFPSSQSLLGFTTLYMVQFLLCGPAMLFYLTHRPYGKTMNKHELKLIPIALAYNLSSYALCYLSFNGFIDLALLLPFLMLGLDRLIYKKKYLLYTVLLAIYMVLNTYAAFMLCEFLFLYFFTMDHKNIKTFLRNGIRFALSSIAAAGLASFTLIPFYNAVMNTHYSTVDKAAGNSVSIFSQTLIGSLKDMEIFHRLSLVSQDTTIANTYCGILLLLSIPLFLCIKKIKLSCRIRTAILLFILYFSYGNELMNFILHGFHFQSLVPNRFSIYMIFMMVICFYDVICNFKDIYKPKAVILFCIFAILIIIGMMVNNPNISNSKAVYSILFIVIYLSIIASGFRSKRKYKAVISLLFILSLELFISNMYIGISIFGYDAKNQNDMQLMRELSDKYNMKDTRLTRAEICNADFPNASCLTNVYSGSMFTSTLQYEQYNLVNTLGGFVQANVIRYSQGNPLANIMLNERYFFYDNTKLHTMPSYMKEIDRNENIILMEDPNVQSFGIIFPENTDFKALEIGNDGSNVFERQNKFTRSIIGKDLYTLLPNNSYTAELEKDGSIKITSELDEAISGDIYATFNNNTIIYMGFAEEGKNNTLVKTVAGGRGEERTDRTYVALLNSDALNELSIVLNKEKLSVIQIEDNKIDISFKNPENLKPESKTVMYIPLPAYSNWKSKIDRADKKIIPLSGGLGIEKQGANIELQYQASRTDIKLYIITFLTIIVLVILRKRK